METSTRRDVLILALTAATLRVIVPTGFGIDHYDEGAYAMTAAALATGGWPEEIYPLQHYLSPPLFFGLAALVMRVVGTTAVSLSSVSVVAGIGTVVLVYLAGRRWFGRAAAGAAALAVTLSDFHILYSRAGLTDVLFAGLFLLAIVLFAKAEEQGSLPIAAVAGVITGLAWNTKYHGWLAVVVAAVAVLPRLFGPNRRPWRPTVGRLVLAAAIAGTLYLPWVLFVEAQEGGYAKLAAEHSRFLRPGQAFQNGLAQLRAQLYLEGWTARLAPLALVCWVMLTNRATRRLDSVWYGALLVLSSLALGATAVIGLLALGAVAMLVRRHGIRWGPHWYPIVFFALFAGLMPLYTPYPRLLLPCFVASTLLASAAIDEMLVAGMTPRLRKATWGFCAALTVLIFARGLPAGAIPWSPRDGLQLATFELNRIAHDPVPIVIVGEPGVVFYLRAIGREAWHANKPDEALRYVPAGSPYYLVGGIYSRRNRRVDRLATWLERHPEATPVGTVQVTDMSDVRLLDDFGPPEARRFRLEKRSDYDLLVYYLERQSP
ncbi:MAG TPA: glycosyltransferase family 39 protein [Vicinamibacterales bacterium]|nr:glycosyltransferase family 39 protein [Vicinamibacterales bacterium]